MLYKVDMTTGNVEVIDLGITEEERRHWAEVDALWELEENEEEEAQD